MRNSVFVGKAYARGREENCLAVIVSTHSGQGAYFGTLRGVRVEVWCRNLHV